MERMRTIVANVNKNIEEKILTAVSDVLSRTVDSGSSLDDVSSLKILQIIMTLDEDGISVPLEKIAKIKSVGDIIAFAEVE